MAQLFKAALSENGEPFFKKKKGEFQTLLVVFLFLLFHFTDVKI